MSERTTIPVLTSLPGNGGGYGLVSDAEARTLALYRRGHREVRLFRGYRLEGESSSLQCRSVVGGKVVLSSNGRMCAVTCDESIELHDLDVGTVRILDGTFEPRDLHRPIAFAAHDQVVAYAARKGGTLFLYFVSTSDGRAISRIALDDVEDGGVDIRAHPAGGEVIVNTRSSSKLSTQRFAFVGGAWRLGAASEGIAIEDFLPDGLALAIDGTGETCLLVDAGMKIRGRVHLSDIVDDECDARFGEIVPRSVGAVAAFVLYGECVFVDPKAPSGMRRVHLSEREADVTEQKLSGVMTESAIFGFSRSMMLGRANATLVVFDIQDLVRG